MQSRTLGAITLGPDKSARGGYHFMNLNTGRKIHRRTWTPLPMPDEVIVRVEQLGKKDKQPKLLVNTDKKGDVPVNSSEDDVEDDLSYYDASYESGNSVSIDEIAGVKYDPEPIDEAINDNVEISYDTPGH